MDALGILGILIGIAALIYLSFKGFSVVYVAPIAGLIVAAFTKLPLLESYTGFFMGGASGFFKSMFPFFFLGAILAQLYGDSGAATAIARGVLKKFAKDGAVSGSRGIWICIWVTVVIGALLFFGGVNGLVAILAMFPLVLNLLKEINVSRKFIPGLIFGGTVFATAAPGSTQMINVIPAQLLGTPPTAALIPGIIGAIILLVLNVLYLYWEMSRSKKNGEVFESRPNDPDMSINRLLPNFWASLIPLIVIFITYNVFKWNLVVSLVFGIVLSMILFSKTLTGEPSTEQSSGSEAVLAKSSLSGCISGITKSLNASIPSGLSATVVACSLVGFGSVVQNTAAFQSIVNLVVGIEGSPLLILAIAVAVIVGVTANGNGGIALAIPLLAPTFIAMDVNPEALHRVATFASTTLDTLPTNAGVLAAIALAGITIKEGYRPVFVTSVIVPIIATLAIVVIMTFFPGTV